MRRYDPSSQLPGPGWYERLEGTIRTVPPSSCWICGSTMTFIVKPEVIGSMCQRCDVPETEELPYANVP